MGRKPKTTKTTAKKEKLDYEKVLGECHDGEDYKLLLKDGTVKIVPKSEVDLK